MGCAHVPGRMVKLNVAGQPTVHACSECVVAILDCGLEPVDDACRGAIKKAVARRSGSVVARAITAVV